MDTRIIKQVCFIVTLSLSGLTIGCSQNKITGTESESINLSTDAGADIAATKPEESIVSSDMVESSMDTSLPETLAEQPIAPTFSVHDIFVSGAPVLNEMPFMLANIVALIKDGTITNIILDMPTAG